MKSHRLAALLTTVFIGGAAILALNLVFAPALTAAAAESGTGIEQRQDPAAFTADSRAQIRTYYLADAHTDVTYCVFASSKVSRNKPAPLIVSLHGWGASPQLMCNKTSIELAEAGGYILAAPMGYSKFGWYGSPVVSMGTASARGPSDQDIRKWSEEDVMNVLGMVREEFNVDPKRIYLTGHSMGGAGALFLASKYADIWAAVAPVAPATFMMNQNRAVILQGIKDGHFPVLIVAGDADSVVAPTKTRMWVDTAKELGMDCQYVELPGIDHGPIITASQKYVYEFFSQHSKQ